MNTRNLLSALSLLLFASCAFALELPANLAARVQELAPGATVTKVKVKGRGGAQVYKIDIELPGKLKGKIELTADGALRKLKIEIAEEALPVPVADAARKLWPGAEFDGAERRVDKGRQWFDIDFIRDDLGLWARVRADGTVLEREDEIDPGALPGPILERLQEQHPGARITKARRRLKDGREFVELSIETHFQLKLTQPEGAKTHLRRMKVVDLPDWARAGVEKATGDNLKGVRVVRKISEPVTVFEVEVKRRSKIEIDLKDLEGNGNRAQQVWARRDPAKRARKDGVNRDPAKRAGKDGVKRDKVKRDRPTDAAPKRRGGGDQDVF